MCWMDSIGGRYWVRTSDPCRVKAVDMPVVIEN